MGRRVKTVRNFDEFVGDERFKELDEKKKKIILEVDRIFENEGYVFRKASKKLCCSRNSLGKGK